MKTLYKNWLTEGLMDVEYKQYILLDYFRSVEKDFQEIKLYPGISDLLSHYENLIKLKENKDLLADSMPKQLTGLDWEKLKAEYRSPIISDEVMKVIEELLEFALPRFKKHLHEGKDIYEFIEEQLSMEPVGITPLNKDFGYMFLANATEKETLVYEYQLSIFQNTAENYRGIHTRYLTTYSNGLTTTYSHIKNELIRSRREMPNPATFVVSTTLSCPLQETLLPITKRMLMRKLSEF